jgi:hypothetical protein
MNFNVNDYGHPITTSSECCRAIIEYIRKHSKAKIVIGEGCGDANYISIFFCGLLGKIEYFLDSLSMDEYIMVK